MTTTYRVPFGAHGVESFRQVPYSRGPRRVAIALVLFFVLAAAALAFVPWQQTAYGEGGVVAYSPADRPQPVQAPVAGRIEEWFVREGSVVTRGDPIARVVDVDPQLITRLQAQLEAARAKVKAAQAAVVTARKNVRRQAELEEMGLSARRTVEEAQIRVNNAEQSLAAARADLVQIETRLARQDVQVVKAPADGVVVRLLEGLGATFVSQGDPIARIVPAEMDPAVELWIDGNDLPLVRVGQEVRLQFEGWPAIQLSGWPALAVGTFGARIRVIDAAAIGPPGKFRILVQPGPGDHWPPSTRLRQGVQAHGWVLLSRVPLGFELWRRFNDFPPTPPPFEEEMLRDGKGNGKPPPKPTPEEPAPAK